jgi:hypothetical protein
MRTIGLLLVGLMITALAACQSQRLGECDPSSSPGINCKPNQNGAPAPKNPPF